MNNPEREEKWNKEFNEEWAELWLPLITTRGYIDELNKLIREDRERIKRLINNEIDYDSVTDVDGEEIFIEEIKLYNEEIDDLVDKIMEE